MHNTAKKYKTNKSGVIDMIAVVFLLLTIFLGYIFVSLFAPYLFKPKSVHMHNTFARGFPKLFIIFPASFSIGVVISGWLLYIPSYIFRAQEAPLAFGTVTALAFMIFFIAIFFYFKLSSLKEMRWLLNDAVSLIRHNIVPTLFFIIVLAYVSWLMIFSFYVHGDYIRIGHSVFSDFAVHTAIIRSFSVGSNFPTQFPHYPDGTMRYHFMFQFFVAALEFMGMRIDFALNIMSIVTLFNVCLLLYVVAVIITNKKAVGMLTVVFFVFRSSFTGLRHIQYHWPLENIQHFFRLVTDLESFIGYTSHQEGWGLWNMNVYANQRHLALGISLILVGMLIMLPLLKKMYNAFEHSLSLRMACKQFFLSADAWVPAKYSRAISFGLLLGAATFFHGSAVITLLSMLAVMGLFSKHRLEYLIIAVITYALAMLQSNFFAPGVELGRPELYYGFISPDSSPQGVAYFIIMLTGVALPLVVIGTIMKIKRFIIFFLMFLVPFVITFTISLTPDVTVNHKYLMISVALLNIFAAYAICVVMGKFPGKLLQIPGKIVGIVLTAFMIFTGVIDLFTYRNINEIYAEFRRTSAYHEWLITNTRPDDVFLTHWYTVDDLLLAGRFTYFGWPYYAWSGGHDTFGRDAIFQVLVNPQTPEEARRLMLENGIDYIVVCPQLTMQYYLYEADVEMLKSIFPIVFAAPEDGVFVLQADFE